MIAGSLACPSCNSTVAPGILTCPNCGSPITGSGTPAVALSDAASPGSWEALLARSREVTSGEYEVLAELGHGGMAAVYLAWH